MRAEIREMAESLGYEISDFDIDQIIDRYHHIIVANKAAQIKNAVRWYFEGKER